METVSLKDYEWEMSYRTSSVNDEGKPVDILHDFYIPALSRIVDYDRVAGYFRSSSLAAASQGFTRFLEHGGHMRLIVGADLSIQDVAAILNGNSKRLSDKLMQELDNEDEWPESVKNGVALLSEMVARGKLEVRVAFRVNSENGQPMAVDSVEDGYVHEKWFIMKDAAGNRLYGSGSLNESRTALTLNAENITVCCDWDGPKQKKHLDRVSADFQAFWENKNPHMKVFSLPEAVKHKLIKLKNLRNKPTEIDDTVIDIEPVLQDEELLKFAVLMDAPKMPNGVYIGMYSAPVDPWPHQEVVARRLVETYPYSYMMCDEVGLGKTIEAALAMRSLILSGRAKRVLVIAPAGLTSQWHHELADKAMLSFAKSWNKPGSGKDIVSEWVYPKVDESQNPSLYDENFNIVSSGLARRNERKRQLRMASRFDIVLLDEAHYARRKHPNKHDIGNAEYGDLYKLISDNVKEKTSALWLATATPMQIDSVEAYDLLRLAGRSGPFMNDPSLCMEYFDVLGKLANDKEIHQQEWSFVGQSFNQLETLDGYLWGYLQKTVVDSRNARVLNSLYYKSPKSIDIKNLKKPLFASSPLARVMQRHTRALLEIYRDKGKLKSNLAKRIIRPIAAIEFTPKEESFYASLEDYCAELKHQIQTHNSKSKQFLLFYLSFLQLRFASSIYAIKKTLGRRLSKVNNTLLLEAKNFENVDELNEALEALEDTSDLDEGYNENDFSSITIDALLKDRTKPDLEWEKARLEDMLADLKSMNETPSKIKRLLEEIQARKHGDRVRQMVLFTRFYDSLISIREYLSIKEPTLRVGVYSGGEVKYYDYTAGKDVEVTRDKIKTLFLNGEIDILLCTDAAAEGLNLQTADLLINFDLGWNPMKIEQRIGRIDRIGQKYTEIQVLNMCYLGSTEEAVYGRLLSRLAKANLVVGAQQISMLHITSEEFRELHDGKLTEEEVTRRAEERLKQEQEQMAAMEMSAQDIYSIYEKLSQRAREQKIPASVADMWSAFSDSVYLRQCGFAVAGDVIRNEKLAGIEYTSNKDKLDNKHQLLTWGSELADKVFAEVGEQLEEKKWIRRVAVNDECITIVGYVVAVDTGYQLITSYEQLKNIRINCQGIVTDDVIEMYRKELLVMLGKESKIYSKMRDTLEWNADYADINAKLVRYAAAGILEKLSSDASDCYLDAMKTLNDNIKKTYIVELPFDIFSTTKKKLLFNINDTSINTGVAVNGVFLSIVIKCIQREVDGMKKRKSEITVSEVVRRLVDRKIS